MDAQEYVDYLRQQPTFLKLVYFTEHPEKPQELVEYGRGDALILNDTHKIAVMLTDCGDHKDTGIKAGALVRFETHPEGESRIVGTPGYVQP